VAVKIGNSVQNIVIGIVAAVVLLLVGIALGPTVLAATADINATALMVDYPTDNTSVPMASIIILLASYVGFFYYLGIVLGAIAMIWATVSRG
jgi:hypothetical protein